jgi:hypothetical protein
VEIEVFSHRAAAWFDLRGDHPYRKQAEPCLERARLERTVYDMSALD